MSESSVVQIAKALFYEKSLIRFDGEFVGAVAAVPKQQGSEDLNYSEVFIRDNVPVMIFLLLEEKFSIVRHFLDTCLRLQSNRFQTRGIFPTSFTESHGELTADYGQRAIGRVSSVDASLWWPILAYIYVQRSGDQEWAASQNVQTGLQSFLDLILHPSFRDAPTLLVPDGSFMIDRPLDVWGNPLEIEVLLYGSLMSAAGLLQANLTTKGYLTSDAQIQQPGSSDPFSAKQIYQLEYAISWILRLRRYLLKNYWINSKTVQTLRRRPTEQYGDEVMNEYNIQTETIPHWLQNWLGDQGGYLIGNVRTGRPDFRFFTLGNCLGAIFDIITPPQQRSLFSLMLVNRRDLFAEMPLRICHPPLDNDDWRRKTGYDRKNLPWCYHNAGHWPCLHWFFVLATLRHRQCYRQSPEDKAALSSLLDESYELLLHQLPRQNWAEYFDGPTGIWIGQQARLYQTWTIVGFLLVHHFMKVNSADVTIMNLPSLKILTRIRFPAQS